LRRIDWLPVAVADAEVISAGERARPPERNELALGRRATSLDHALRMVQLGLYVKEAPELVVSADIVAGKHVQTTEAAKQHVLGAPATQAA
jgi:hypothetical protein